MTTHDTALAAEDDPADDPFAGLTRTTQGEALADPYPRFGELQAKCPVQPDDSSSLQGLPRSPLFGVPEGYPCYTVLDLEHAETVLKHPETFAQGYNTSLDLVLGRTILSMGGAEHRTYRSLIQQAFGRREMERWEHDYVTPTIHQCIDAFAGRCRADLVAELTHMAANRIISKALGLPEEDLETFHGWATQLLNVGGDPVAGFAAGDNLSRYCIQLAGERRGGHGTDLVSLLANATVGDRALNDEEIASFIKLLLPAGSDTTYRASSNLLFGLLTNPDQLDLVRQDRSLVPQAIEEGLRWEPPISFIARVAMADAEVAGVEIPSAAFVEVGLGPANRDPGRWEDPHRFDITRLTKPHLAFSTGEHTCLGVHLARLTISVTLNAVFDRLPNVRLDPSVDPTEIQIMGINFRAPHKLPVVFDA